MIEKRILVSMMVIIAITMTIIEDKLTKRALVQQVTQPVVKAQKDPKQEKFERYFKSIGSPVPAMMATAVIETSSPSLYAAIVSVESSGDPKAIGDSGQSKGATQVKAKHWKHLLTEGKVSKDPVVQLKDTERILTALRKEHKGNLRVALNRYGGCTDNSYANIILAKVQVIKKYKV